nr:MAG: p33 protein [Sanya tombus-like virus 4]
MDVLSIIGGLLLVLGSVSSVIFWWWWCSRLDEGESIARDLWNEAYKTPVDGPSGIVAEAVAHCHAIVGALGDNKANRLVVSDVVRRFMREHGMRPTHILERYPMAVEAYFMASPSEMMASKARRSKFKRHMSRPAGSA